MNDLISRQSAIDALGERPIVWTDDDEYALGERNQYDIDRLAIETVPSAQPVARDINVLSNDLISRQDAIETSLEFFVEFLGGAFHENSQKELIARFQRLPSAQPELHYDEWCTDCKEYDQERHCCPRFNKVIRETVEEYKAEHPEPCEDAVSRAEIVRWTHFWFEAVDIKPDRFIAGIKRLPSAQPVARDMNVLSNDLIIRQATIDQLHQSYNLLDAERRLEDMPSVQLERPKGHWVHRGCGVFECDQCGKLVSTNVYKSEKVSDSFKFCPECGLDMRGGQE